MMGHVWSGWAGGFWMLGGLLLMIGAIVVVVWAVMTITRTGPADGRYVAPRAERDPPRAVRRGDEDRADPVGRLPCVALISSSASPAAQGSGGRAERARRP